MTFLAFTFGVVIGAIGVYLWLVAVALEDDEDPLDSEAEYVDNTPTFR